MKCIRQAKQVLKCKIYVLGYLLVHPCVDCGESDPVVLDFDHRANKDGEIAQRVKSGWYKGILTEIPKCDVRCSNCHRRRHTTSGSYKVKTIAELQQELVSLSLPTASSPPG